MLGRPKATCGGRRSSGADLSRARHNLSSSGSPKPTRPLPAGEGGSQWVQRAPAAGGGPRGLPSVAVLASWQAVCLMPGGAAAASSALMGICLAQELLALRLALEEGWRPRARTPRELSFTKSSRLCAGRGAGRPGLACSSQCEQLRGWAVTKTGCRSQARKVGACK